MDRALEIVLEPGFGRYRDIEVLRVDGDVFDWSPDAVDLAADDLDLRPGGALRSFPWVAQEGTSAGFPRAGVSVYAPGLPVGFSEFIGTRLAYFPPSKPLLLLHVIIPKTPRLSSK